MELQLDFFFLCGTRAIIVIMNIPDKQPTMINKPRHTQRIEFFIEELYTLQAREREREKKDTSYQLD